MAEALLWVCVTACAAALAYAVVSPVQCSASELCQHAEARMLLGFSQSTLYALGGFVMHDALSHLMVRLSNRAVAHIVPNIRTWFLSTELVCSMFIVLCLEHLILAKSTRAWYAHISDASLPVYTVVYVEWLFNVPILLTLTGTCALGIPLQQIRRPILVTNLYIVLSWAAHFISHQGLRWGVVCGAFGMYAHASRDMLRWRTEFDRRAPLDAAHRVLKQILPAALVIVFGLYGAIYLFSFTQRISAQTERWWYLTLDICTKMAMSMCITVIRFGEIFDFLLESVIQTHIPFQRQHCSLEEALSQIDPDIILSRVLSD